MLSTPQKYGLSIAIVSALYLLTVRPALGADLFQEQAKLINAPKAVGVLGAGLFGDQVNFYSGALSFEQTDINLKGNNSLPVSVGRRLSAGTYAGSTMGGSNNHFGRWELDIPHLHGMFSAQRGWTVRTVAGITGARCSSFGKPPDAQNSSGGIGSWSSTEYWHGSFLYVPGSGDQELLKRGSNPHIPTDGMAYPVVTRNLWAIGCVPSLKNGIGVGASGGEGFLAVAPNGTRYKFDWIAKRAAEPLEKSTAAPDMGLASNMSDAKKMSANKLQPNEPTPMIVGEGERLSREEIWILPSLVTDKFGNTVTYTYDTARPWQLKSITASDGRSIGFTYVPNTDMIATATAMPNSPGARTWTYAYDSTGPQANLATVTLPDLSSWKLLGAKNLLYQVSYITSPRCEDPGVINPEVLVGSMTHPSGAVGTFTLNATIHGRAGVERMCRNENMINEYSNYPNYFANFALTKKVLSGPGIGNLQWSTVYPAAVTSWYPCTGCIASKKVAVTDPSGTSTEYTFGTLSRITEGQLQQTDIFDSNGGLLRSTRVQYRDPVVGPFPNPMGYSDQSRGDGEMASRLQVEEKRVITQQGEDFTWQVNGTAGIDAKGRPVDVTRWSTLDFARRELTTLEDNNSKWVLGLLKKTTEASTGAVPVENEYDPTSSTLLKAKRFGFLDRTMTYRADGTLATARDGKDQTTSYGSFKRGIAQSIVYHNATNESYAVNDFGDVTSHTDQNGYTTSFVPDSLGRVREITYPAGSVAWNKTTIAYDWIAGAEMNVGPGHWRQTVTTGASAEVNVFDAFWRVAYSTQSDLNNPTGTAKFVHKTYDFNGNVLFSSFPKRSFQELNGGVTNSYDGLGRVTTVRTDSELGVLTSSNTYGTDFKTTSYDPLGNVTTKLFQAFDQPSDSAIVSIVAPEGVTINIDRDIFGKTKSITRSGGGKSATRSYVYDSMHRLCKSTEPETGATVQDYDLANNVTWRASGLDLPSTNCDTLSVATAKKVSFSYDVLNRLETTNYGDASPSISRSYWLDGMPKTVNSNGANWTYNYNSRRMIETEILSYGGLNYGLTHAYDANGSAASLTYPDSTVVNYLPNALGEPTQVGGFASGITYHPNGAIKAFSYGNGIAHSLTQSLRGLPEISSDVGVLRDTYAFDASGNVKSILDGLEGGLTNRVMEYDGLDRLKSVNAPGVWGDAYYDYDALDNLIASKLTAGSGIARTMVHEYENNKLKTISGTGGFAFAYTYDSQGNITQRGVQSFVFDQGNRISSAPGKATYGYDGHGRRASIVGLDGTNRLQMYAQDGKLVYAGPTSSIKTKYIYLHNHVIAEVGGAGTIYNHTDGLGSPVARTNSTAGLISRTRYEPYGGTAAGTQPSIGFTGHVNDYDTGLTYMQQRYYDPVAGRFLSIDPVTTDANTGSSFNRYNYANNNPYRYIDPDGRQSLSGNMPSYSPMVQLEMGIRTFYGQLLEKTTTVLHAASLALGAPEVVATKVVLIPAATRAAEIAAAMGSTQRFVTIAVTDTAEGVRLISSSEKALRPSAMAALKEGEVAVTGLGHAELTGANAAAEMGLTPIGTAASRPICADCAAGLAAKNIEPLSPLKGN